jgi:hypothetical protein
MRQHVRFCAEDQREYQSQFLHLNGHRFSFRESPGVTTGCCSRPAGALLPNLFCRPWCGLLRRTQRLPTLHFNLRKLFQDANRAADIIFSITLCYGRLKHLP